MNDQQPQFTDPPLSLKTRWLLVLGAVFVLAIICSGCVTLLYYGGIEAIKTHPAVKPVIDRVNANEKIAAALGSPLKFGVLGEDAQVNVGKTDGFARYSLPVEGPKGTGKAIVHATMTNNEWKFEEMSFQVTGQMELIDLQGEVEDSSKKEPESK